MEPGTAGENITVEGLNVQELPTGTLLEIGDILIRLEAPRKPCYVLDVIDPRLKDVIIGRCGYMASVLQPGVIYPGMTIRRIDGDAASTHLSAKHDGSLAKIKSVVS